MAGALFAAALAIVYFDGYNVDRNAYETGELFGAAIRNVAIGLVAGLLVNLLANRRRLTRVSWRELICRHHSWAAAFWRWLWP